MKNFTMLLLMLFGAVSFAQQTTLKANGVDNPTHYSQQQKSKTVVLTESQRNAESEIKNLGPKKPNVESQRETKSKISTPEGQRAVEANIKAFGGNNPKGKQSSGVTKGIQLEKSLFGTLEQEEILAAEAENAQGAYNVSSFQNGVGQNKIMAQIIPTAGATESFAVAVGDFFYDPSDGVTGGPGGDCSTTSSGDPGDYPNCGCTTVTTLTGTDLSVEFLSFRVFGTFDYLNIYDGPNTSSPKIYDSNLNNDTDTLAGMIAAHGSAVFNSTTDTLTFEFHATSVVNTCGWEVEVISGGGGGTFPDPYCPVTYGTVEPITLVEVADISNRSSEVINGSPAHEDFTAVVGNMEEGESYTIALEGNTNGGFTCSFTVFIDWNQDGILDNASERYEIGTINNSTGIDGKQATNTITVPAGVVDGPTRMRVMKKFGSTYSVDSCTGTSWGQAEDYTINVTSGGGTGTACSQNHPFGAAAAGGSGSSVDSDFKTAADIIVVAGEDFTLDTIEVPFLTFAPLDPPTTANVVYYAVDSAGLPGAVIGSETVVPTILSSAPWANPVAFQFMTSLAMTPFKFAGDASSDTTYWIEVSMGTASNQGTVFWEYTDDIPVEGQPYAKFDASVGTWEIEDPNEEVIYVFSGECEPMGTSGGPCATTGPSNNMENGKSFTKNLGRIVANDITVAAGEDMLLESINITAFIGGVGSGVNADNVDVIIYSDSGTGSPGAIYNNTYLNLVPSSQTNIGDAFGFQAWSVDLDVNVNLPGQAGAPTTYWIGLSLEPTDGSNTFWEFSSAGVIGYGLAYNDGTGFVMEPNNEGVYTFAGICSPMGTGGDPCGITGPSNNMEDGKSFTKNLGRIVANDITIADGEDMMLETINISAFIGGTGSGVNASNVDVFIYRDSGTGSPGDIIDTQLSFVPTSQTVIGSNFGYDLWNVELDIADVYLPGQIGSTTTYWIGLSLEPTDGSNTFWEYSSAGVIGYGLGYNDGTGYVMEPANEGVYTFAGTCSPATGIPFNDDCSGAFALSCGDSVTGQTTLATDSGGNPAPDVFYKYTGSGAAQFVTISLCGGGTDYDSVLRIFDDCDLSNEIAMNDDFCGTQSQVTFLSDGTSTYYIMVEGFGSNSGNFSLDVTCMDPLPNDFCTGAIAMNCGESVTGTTVGATIDSDAPTCGPSITSPGVWYSFDDNRGMPGELTFSLCDGSTNFDTKLSVYKGTCAALVCVAGNDDFCGLQSEVTITSDGNTKYYILVHSFGGATGTFTLDAICTPTPPPNDRIANSIYVNDFGFPYTDPAVAMPAATPEDGNPQGCDLTGANGVWYHFTSGGDGHADATIITPGGASSVTFYTAPSLNAVETDLVLVPQNSNQCVPGTSASIYTLAGQIYYVFVLNSGAITDIVIDGTNLGVGNNTLEGFTYYPNPTNGVLNLSSKDNIETVTIYNLLGQTVLTNNVGATGATLDISGLSVGTYMMKATVNGQVGVYKIVKK